MTEEQYQLYFDAVDEACQGAGSNDGHWNVRFILELDRLLTRVSSGRSSEAND